jgi:hypothetical protein
MRLAIVGMAGLLSIVPALAEPRTFSCEHYGGESVWLPGIEAVDQIVVDKKAGSIEFRVAKTMGTGSEAKWAYQDGEDGFTAKAAPAYMTLVKQEPSRVTAVTFTDTIYGDFAWFVIGYVSDGSAAGPSWRCKP